MESQMRTLERRAYSIREGADILGVSERFLYECCRTGRIRATRLGSRWILPAGVLRELLNEAVPAVPA